MKLLVTIPGMRLRSPNAMRGTTRGARMALAKYTRNTREATRWFIFVRLIKAPQPLPVVVTLTRIAPRDFDSDNLAMSFKAARDGIADALGVDDGSARVTWRYAQRRGLKGQYAVVIEIEPRQDDYPADVPEMVERVL